MHAFLSPYRFLLHLAEAIQERGERGGGVDSADIRGHGPGANAEAVESDGRSNDAVGFLTRRQ